MTIVARWESRSGKHWVILQHSVNGYSYVANGCGGSLGPVESGVAAVTIMQEKVDSGYFLPDNAKLPMRRIV